MRFDDVDAMSKTACFLLLALSSVHNPCVGLDIPIAGIFKINSPAENAFSHAVYRYNLRKDRKFRLNSSLAMLPLFESHTVINKICQQATERKVMAIFGGNFSFVSQDISDLATTLNLPIFITDDQNYKFTPFHLSSKQNFVFQLHSPSNDPLVEFLVHQKWTTFSYICNSGQCLHRLQRLIEKIHLQKDYVELNVDVRYISDVRLASKDLRNLNAYLDSVSQHKRILIDMDSQDNLELLLYRIVLMGMNRPEYDYIITNVELEDLDLTDFKYSGVNITGFKLVDRHSERFKSFFNEWKDWTAQPTSTRIGSVTQAALMQDAINVFVETMEKLLEKPQFKNALLNAGPIDCYTLRMPDRRKIFGYQSGMYEIKKSSVGTFIADSIVSGQHRNGLTGNIEFTKSGFRKNFNLTFMTMEMDVGLIPMGSWNEETGLNISTRQGTRITVEMIKNQTIRVVSIISPPFLQLKVPKNKEILQGNDRYEGFCVDMLNQTAQMLGFKYDLHLVHDNNFGVLIKRLANNTEIWNGMIGELLNGTADMAVAPLTINLARARVVSFSEPYLTFGISMMIKKPGKKNPGIFSFMRPLADNVWGSYFAACLIVSCGLYVITRLSPYEWIMVDNESEGLSIKRNFTFYNSIWFSFAALVQQGVDLAPKSPGARILSSVWWFFTLIMTAYYTANLVAFLTISLMITPINDFADLIKPGIGMEYGSLDSGSTKDFFLTTTLYPFREMGNVMKRNPLVFPNTTENGVKRVLKSKGKYAFLVESRMNEYYNNREPCQTMMVGSPFGDKGYGIATPLNYPMKDEINDAVLKLRENQFLDTLYKHWWIQKGVCSDDNTQSKLKALTLNNVAGVFYILTAGLTFALITSLIEFYYNARKNFRKQTDTFAEFLHHRARISIHGPAIETKYLNRPFRLATSEAY